MRGIQTTILYEEMPSCRLLLRFVVLWLKWHVTRSVRDIYETAKNTKEIEQRLADLVEYMKWKSEEMLAAYQHYFDEQRHADTQGQFHKRMHAEVQRYLAERQQRKMRKQTPGAPKDQIPSPSSIYQFDEPD